MPPRPLIVVEGPPATFASALQEVRAAGWQVEATFAVPAGADPRRVVCTGTVGDDATAGRALLAAVHGAGLVIDGQAERVVLDRLCDDLRRLGPLDHRVGDQPEAPALSAEQQALLDLLRAGCTLGEAAARLHVSRRTADRRLAAARRALGADSTAEAVLRARL